MPMLKVMVACGKYHRRKQTDAGSALGV
jgi:hypothetical protein